MGKITKFIKDRVKDGSAAITAAAASVAYTASSLYTHMAQDTTGSLPQRLNNLLDYGASQLPHSVTDKLIDLGYLHSDPTGYGVDVPNVSTPMAAGFAGLTAGLLGCKLSGDDARKETEAYKKIDGAIMDEIIQDLENGKDIDSLDETQIYDNVLRKLENEKGSGFWIFKDGNKRALETFSKYKGTVDQEGSYLNVIKELKENAGKEGYERLATYLKNKQQMDEVKETIDTISREKNEITENLNRILDYARVMNDTDSYLRELGIELLTENPVEARCIREYVFMKLSESDDFKQFDGDHVAEMINDKFNEKSAEYKEVAKYVAPVKSPEKEPLKDEEPSVKDAEFEKTVSSLIKEAGEKGLSKKELFESVFDNTYDPSNTNRRGREFYSRISDAIKNYVPIEKPKEPVQKIGPEIPVTGPASNIIPVQTTFSMEEEIKEFYRMNEEYQGMLAEAEQKKLAKAEDKKHDKPKKTRKSNKANVNIVSIDNSVNIGETKNTPGTLVYVNAGADDLYKASYQNFETVGDTLKAMGFK